jgi:hypothetical protein
MTASDWYARLLLLSIFLLAPAAFSQDTQDATTHPASAAPAPAVGADELSPPGMMALRVTPFVSLAPAPRSDFWPDLDGPSLGWLAALVILLLTFRFPPLINLRNLDGLVLAGMAVVLGLRANDDSPEWLGGRTLQWLAATLLAAGTGYWLLRGFGVIFSRSIPRLECNLAAPAMLVLVVASAAVGIHRIASAPISDGSRDGVVGGLGLLSTGKLPYGDATGFDTRSPLLYGLHAGAVRVLPLTFVDEDSGLSSPVAWKDRQRWLGGDWELADFSAARAANATLFVLMLIGLYLIGARLHSAAIGLAMVAIFCVFPGSVECLPRPEIMLPATLLTWMVYTALLPGFASFLAIVLAAAAGIAWPWAFFGLPALLVHFFRRGAVSALGAVVGLVGVLAGGALGVTALTAPTFPRAEGALAAAGTSPRFIAVADASGEVTVQPREATETPRPARTAPLWRFLSGRDALDVKTTFRGEPGGRRVTVNFGEGAREGDVKFNDVEARGAAREQLLAAYRTQIDTTDDLHRFWASARTVVESTWLPAVAPADPAPPVWDAWSGGRPGKAVSDTRAIVKLVAGLITLLAAGLLLLGDRRRPHHLLGALVVAGAAGLLASAVGPATNLIWLVAVVLPLWAIHWQPPAPSARPVAGSNLESVAHRLGPAPRITTET